MTLTVLGAQAYAPAIEHDLARRTAAALDAAGYPHTLVRVDGRNAVLIDAPPGRQREALDVAATVDGLHSATQSVVDETLVLTAQNGHLHLSGVAGSDRERRRAVRAVRERLPGMSLVDGITVVPGHRLPLRPERLASVASALAPADGGPVTLSWRPERITLAGEPGNPAAAGELRKALAEAAPGAVVDDRLTPGSPNPPMTGAATRARGAEPQEEDS